MEVTYTTENPGHEYAKAIDNAKTSTDLAYTLMERKRFAGDAIAVAQEMTAADFNEFRAGLAKERRGKSAGAGFAKKYGAILMPEKLLISSLVESEYKVPWGFAFIRCEEEKWPMLKASSMA
jgi:hypothetical protein